MTKRIRITIEIDTRLERSDLNAMALRHAGEMADCLGVLAYCATEEIQTDEQRVNTLWERTIDHSKGKRK